MATRPVSAAQANNVKVKFGAVNFTAKQGAVASMVGNQLQITLGGGGKQGTGFLTITLEASEIAQLEKGLRLGVVSTGNSSSNDNAVNVLFNGTRTQGKGKQTKQVGFVTLNDSVGNGNFRVVNYNPQNKKLKFNLQGRVKPYNKSVAKLLGGGGQTNKTINKFLPFKAQGTVTLP